VPGHLQDSVLLAFKTTGTQWRHMNFGIKDVEVMYSLARIYIINQTRGHLLSMWLPVSQASTSR